MNLTSRNMDAEAATEVNLNVNKLRKQDVLDDADIYREKLHFGLFHH